MYSLMRPSMNVNRWFDWEDLFPTDLFSSAQEIQTNITTTDNGYKISVVAPGLNKTDFKIDLDENTLTVSFDVTAEGKSFVSQKRFSKSWSLPKNTLSDEITADYTNGILNVSIPLSESKKEVKSIKVN